MGHCTAQPLTLSKFPNSFAFHSKPSFSLKKQTLVTPSALLLSRSIFLRNVLRRAIESEETSSGVGKFFNEKRDSVITLEADKNGYNETVENEDSKEELPSDGEFLPLDFLDKLNFDVNDTTSLVVYGSGAIVTLWLISAVVGAIDSIPLFPKLFEVVGLGYSLWFTYRYLLFKRNRDELTTKIEQLKEQILGSDD
ncbi:protein CURVATURE THYLAKOID 1D, chloroplastic isoform X2 [Cicer arietinum]|uniref:Protein CURVATURE THYLAKOID 1D, chloroplastic isoform X2 n=1 Tax=Cicer arietinum TaxID=3827 RepID=A0A1S2XI91_CICAR|nr:protein CURVATURE THYLAKOID 1D, chloroplastic isoform X2 [Cicer arietinum]